MQEVNLNFSYFFSYFYFIFDLFSFILFLEYKIDNLVQSSLLSSLVLTQYKVLLLDQL